VTHPIAYGLALAGPAVSPALAAVLPEAGEVPAGWPAVTVRYRIGTRTEQAAAFSGSGAVVPSAAGGHLVFERAAMEATFEVPARHDDLVLAHPCLAGVGLVAAAWLDRPALHGGAFVVGGEAWGLLGGVSAGKSTLLAALHGRGHDVLSDDLVVIEDGRALAGPRVLSLRPDAAERLGSDAAMVQVGGQPRARLRIGPAPIHAELRGLLLVDYDDDAACTGVERVPAWRCPRVLAASLAHPDVRPTASALLDLAALPVWRITGARRWSEIDRVVDAIGKVVDARRIDAA